MPVDYLKDALQIRISRKPFKSDGEKLAIQPEKKLPLGDQPLVIAQKSSST